MQKPKICSKINHRNRRTENVNAPSTIVSWRKMGSLRSWRDFARGDARVLLLWWRSRERERQSPRRLVRSLNALEFFERKIAALLPNTARSRIPPATRRGRGREGSCLNLASKHFLNIPSDFIFQCLKHLAYSCGLTFREFWGTMDHSTIFGRGWGKYRDLSVADISIIFRSQRLRPIIDLRDASNHDIGR